MRTSFFKCKTLYNFLLFVLFFFSTTITITKAEEYFNDNFTDSDGVLLSNHNNLWQGYTFLNNAIINNNMLKSAGNNSSYYIPSLGNLTDYCVKTDFTQPLPQTPPPDFFAISTRRSIEDHSSHHYDAGYQADGLIYLTRDYAVGLYSSTPNLADGVHTIKLCSVGAYHSLYLDGTLLTTAFDDTYSSGAPGFDLGNNTPLDNFIVTSTEATPTPTITPTPTPTSISLLVPELKQTNPFWKSQIYDTAKKWSPQDPSIGSWGCALTSATMVLNYYNIVKLPDTSFITPGTLNKWLNSQKDGYVGDGLVNWLAISRLSKLAKSSGNNPNFGYDALEFDRKGYDSNQLTNDIQANRPDILEEPGHFIVAKGIQNTTFAINDPYYSRTTLADGYNNSFISLDRYIPSHTDLSYFLITGQDGLQLTLKDNENNPIGDTFTQGALQNETNPLQKSGASITELLAKIPTTGNYILSLKNNSPAIYSITFYLYDKTGEPNIKTISGFVDPDDQKSISFSYNHDDNKKTAFQKVITFNTLIADIHDAIVLKKIDKNIGNSLLTLVTTAQKTFPKNKNIAVQTLKAAQLLITTTRTILIQPNTSAILTDDLTILIKSIK